MDGDMATDAVWDSDGFVWLGAASKAQGPRKASIELGADVVHGELTVDGPFAIVTGGKLLRFLLGANITKLFFCSEGWVSLTLGYETFCNHVVNIHAFALVVWGIIALVAF